jgi:pimeloyl-ACP methyl ester carboxylesterase
VPGFGFSGATREKGWGVQRVARAWATLMARLGYQRYGVQGGDFGSIISPEVARVAPQHVTGVHLNALANASTALTPAELAALSDADRSLAQANQARWYSYSGYATQMSTRPQTLAYGLNDSPAGQLAWNLEWFVDWDPTSTRQTPIDRGTILTNVTTIWVTGTAGSAARLDKEAVTEAWGKRPQPSGVPTGVANFAGDRAVRGLAELSHTITRWKTYQTGGHFASIQAPDLLVRDIREFFGSLRRPARRGIIPTPTPAHARSGVPSAPPRAPPPARHGVIPAPTPAHARRPLA